MGPSHGCDPSATGTNPTDPARPVFSYAGGSGGVYNTCHSSGPSDIKLITYTERGKRERSECYSHERFPIAANGRVLGTGGRKELEFFNLPLKGGREGAKDFCIYVD